MQAQETRAELGDAASGTDAETVTASRAESADGAPPAEMEWQRRKDLEVFVIAVFVLIMGLLLEVTPGRDGVHLFGRVLPKSCPLKVWSGIGCPGCGLTRSFILGLRGSPEAFELHRIGPVFLAIVMFQIPYRGLRLLRARRLAREGLVDLTVDRGRLFGAIVRHSLIIAIIANWAWVLFSGGNPS